MTEPVRVGELLPGVLAEVIDRAGHGYDAVGRAGRGHRLLHPPGARCAAGSSTPTPQTGEVRTVYSTDREPDATLLKACGNRRASVCPSCSATYQADSFQLLAAGLRGGKGVPETVAAHPRLFVTFTAPSFGRVHSRKAQGRLVYPCHPYRQGQTLPAWQAGGLLAAPRRGRPRLGEPLCARCYQTGAQVLWNALAGRLWSRTTIYLYRALAQLAGRDRGRAAAAGPDLVRQGGRVPEARGGPLPRHHPPGRRHRLRLPGLCGPAPGWVHRRAARGGRPAGRRDRGRALPGRSTRTRA